MQVIKSTIKDVATGKERLIKLNVRRSWTNAGGQMVMLLENGQYVYKNGEPVKSGLELSQLIGDPHQRAAAMAYFTRSGEAFAASYYAARDKAVRARSGVADTSEFDPVLYVQRAIGATDWLGPFAWAELFARRPQWWGAAEQIQIDGKAYLRQDFFQLERGEKPESPAPVSPGPEAPVVPPPAADPLQIIEGLEPGDLLTEAGQPYPSKANAMAAISRKQLNDTHEAVELPEGGFVLRIKAFTMAVDGAAGADGTNAAAGATDEGDPESF